MGIETTTWLGISGGVTMAATINMITIAARQYLRKNSGPINPNLVKN